MSVMYNEKSSHNPLSAKEFLHLYHMLDDWSCLALETKCLAGLHSLKLGSKLSSRYYETTTDVIHLINESTSCMCVCKLHTTIQLMATLKNLNKSSSIQISCEKSNPKSKQSMIMVAKFNFQ